MNSTTRYLCTLLPALLFGVVDVAAQDVFQDSLVQPPSLKAPQRGSVAGSLSQFSIAATGLSRGTVDLTLPIEPPTARGVPLADFIPKYSTEAGASEWGMGWSVDLTIRRHRVLGDVRFDDTDEFTSPWGRLTRGDDGYFYPAGLRTVIRLEQLADGGWVGVTGDGTRYTFLRIDAVGTPRGNYAWGLSRVESVVGHVTQLTWQANASGRHFLEKVEWGGQHAISQYEARFSYENVARPLVSYVSGTRQELDRRVAAVTMYARDAGGMRERYSYRLAYRSSALSPVFYLASIQRRFASGELEPAVAYDYDLGVERLQSATLRPEPSLDNFLSITWGSGLAPDHVAMTDLDDDGVPELEHHYAASLVRRRGANYELEALPPAPGRTNPLCRPAPSADNQPRVLARMRPGSGEPHVVVAYRQGLSTTSSIEICDRVGTQLASVQVPGAWDLNENVRLVDLDADRRPDFISVSPGGVEVLANTSTGQSFSFADPVSQALTPALSPTASWVVDLNGDSKPDVVSRTSSGLTVWYGKGSFQFDPEGEFLTFDGENGGAVSDVNQYQVSFGDLNGDGLSDVLLTRFEEVHVYLNQLDHFFEVIVPGLSSLNFVTSLPRIADLSASGDAEIVLVNAQRAFTIALNGPSTGLLRKVDDGKGTLVEFGYKRTPPAAGFESRASVLASLYVNSAGSGTVYRSYDYAAPVGHSQSNAFLGFRTASSTLSASIASAPLIAERATFFHDDAVAGILLNRTLSDTRVPGIEEFTQHDFEAREFHGVPWRRPTATEHGHRSTTAANVILSSRTEFEAYEREFCPVRTAVVGARGSLVKELGLDQVPGLPVDLQCVEDSQVVSGVHDDAAYDFTHTLLIERNDLGQVVRATQDGPTGPIVLQENTFDNDILATSAAPGRGVTRFEHDALGRFTRVTAPDGRATRIGSFDSVTDAIKEFREERGSAVAQHFFAYDGMERLSSSWNSFSGSTANKPLERVRYAFATATRPGRIDLEQLVDVRANVTRRASELVAANGQQLAAAHWAGTWLFSRVERTESATGTTFAYERMPLAGTSALETLGLDVLTGTGVEQIVRRVNSPLGFETESQTLVQSGTRGGHSTTWTLAADQIVQRRVEIGGGPSELAFDEAGRVVRARDEAGAEWLYEHDALGRLVLVATPDGDQKLTLDAYGRPAKIERTGLTTITYHYDQASGMLAAKRILSPSGVLQREERTTYDSLGRASVITSQAGAASTQVRYDYDGVGAEGDGSTISGQLGHVSRVRTDQYERRQRIDAAGRVVASVEKLGKAWRDVSRDVSYRANGEPETVAVTVRDGTGRVLNTTRLSTQLDSYGRSQRGVVNGNVLYTLSYGARGALDRAVFADGHVLSVQYDAKTNARSGYTLRGPVQNGGISWSFDARGNIQRERNTNGTTELERRFAYDTRGYLEKISEGAVDSTYTYSLAGSPTRVKDVLGDRNVTRGTSRVGTSTYGWDAIGRVNRRDDMTFGYGPNGELSSATKSGRTLRYYYDQDKNRVLKTVNGTPERAWVAGGVLTSSAFYLPVVIDGIAVGVLENGVFKPIVTDPRGTPTSSPSGASYLATPYGVRSAHGALSEVVDFAQLGYDADLGTVRMGLRDYDPKLSQFWTPDPLFLEDLGKCQERPAECGLYGYAANNPLLFTDRAGTDAKGERDLATTAWGAVKLLGGVLEVGAGLALLAAPDPTLLTKAGGWVVLAHASDTMAAGLTQMWYGQPERTNTAKVVTGIARAAGASEADALLIGDIGDAVLPIVVTGLATQPLPLASRGAANVADDVGVVAKKLCFPAGTPILTPAGFVSIEQIEVGDEVLTLDGQTGELVVRPVEATFENVTDRLVKIAYAGGELEATLSHPFWVEEHGWVDAQHVQPGMLLRGPDRSVEVERVSVRETQQVVFNFSVAEENTYFAGHAPVLVHNQDLSFSSYNAAIKDALSWLRSNGVDTSKLTEVRESRIGNGRGLGVPGGKAGFRVEWDPKNGAHINAWAGKTKSVHFKFPGNEKSVSTLLRTLYCR